MRPSYPGATTFAAAWLTAIVEGCSAHETGNDSEPGTSSAAESTDDGPNTTVPPPTTGADADAGGTTGDPSADVCTRWLSGRADLSEGAWSGSAAGCDPGDVAENGRANALRSMNLYRDLAGVPPLQLDTVRSVSAQACALMMHANGQLSHTPPADWACYTEQGAMAAASGSISPTPAVAAVDLYMIDPGNPDTLGHRRWILSSRLTTTGIGSTDAYSCMSTVPGGAAASSPWTAFPWPGEFPLAAASNLAGSVDATGWSIQSDSIDLTTAQVTITADGVPAPVTVQVLAPNYGSTSAIAMLPMGWQLTAGVRYHVAISGVSQKIAYDVDVVDCGG